MEKMCREGPQYLSSVEWRSSRQDMFGGGGSEGYSTATYHRLVFRLQDLCWVDWRSSRQDTLQGESERYPTATYHRLVFRLEFTGWQYNNNFLFDLIIKCSLLLRAGRSIMYTIKEKDNDLIIKSCTLCSKKGQ